VSSRDRRRDGELEEGDLDDVRHHAVHLGPAERWWVKSRIGYCMSAMFVSYGFDKRDIQLDYQLALPVWNISIQLLHSIRYERLAKQEESENETETSRDRTFGNEDRND
jgi:hypothetical protein